MSARGMSARGLRAFLLVAAFQLVALNTNVNASSLGTVIVGNGSQPDGGRFNWTRSGGTNSFIPTNFNSFCVDEQGASAGTYTIQDTIVGLPIPGSGAGTPITASNVGRIIKLVTNYIDGASPTLTNLRALTTGSLTWQQANIAFQAALWQLMGVSNGLNHAGASGAVRDYADAMFADANSSYSGFTENSGPFKVLGMTREGGQDQIIIMDRPSFLQVVPVPTGVVMAGMGIVCLGGVNFLRRRKVVAAV